jgi:phosphoribosylamine--glycine ligase
VLTPALESQAIETIIKPTIAGMAKAGTPYSGVLYAGLMLTRTGPKLIEYNARFGDPECQVLMTRYQGDLVSLMLAVATKQLASCPPPAFSADAALTVVMAAKGYPGVPQKGGHINIEAVSGAKVFHAGTAEINGQLVAAGGRVLNVTATGPTVRDAQAAAYAAVDAVDFPTGFCRRDIGWREVQREVDGQ